jgi:hypothetical protein
MSFDTALLEIVKISGDNSYERINHLSARQKVYSSDSDLQWFSELLGQQRGLSIAKIISMSASAEQLASMSLEVEAPGGLYDPDRLRRKSTRVRIPLLTGIRVRLPGKIPEVKAVEEVSGKVVEEAAPHVAQEIVKEAPKPRRSVKKSTAVTQEVIPEREEKPVGPAERALQADDHLVPPPKPLKVIRRRRAEEPKIFETVPKSFPRAMLEGIKLTPEEKGEKPFD